MLKIITVMVDIFVLLTQDECLAMDDIPPPSMCKEELFVLAVRVRFHLAFHYLQLCVKIPNYPRPPKNQQSPHLLMISKRILTSSAHVLMGASDRAFIYQCLQDCLWRSSNRTCRLLRTSTCSVVELASLNSSFREYPILKVFNDQKGSWFWLEISPVVRESSPMTVIHQITLQNHLPVQPGQRFSSEGKFDHCSIRQYDLWWWDTAHFISCHKWR